MEENRNIKLAYKDLILQKPYHKQKLIFFFDFFWMKFGEYFKFFRTVKAV